MKITRIQNTAISGRIAGSRPKAELAAARFVRRMGIRPNLTGYRYLITAIELGLRCPQLTESMTYRMYPNVAEYYGANPGAVERNIRKAIESAYDNDPQRLRNQFYYRVGRPSVSEVIALAVDTIQLNSGSFADPEQETAERMQLGI